MIPTSNSLVWFRRDLRAFDHAALHHALRDAVRDAELRRLGGGLVVRHGAARELIPRLAAELGAATVYVNGDYEPGALERDAAVAQALEADGRRLLGFKDGVVFEKSEVLTLS